MPFDQSFAVSLNFSSSSLCSSMESEDEKPEFVIAKRTKVSPIAVILASYQQEP